MSGPVAAKFLKLAADYLARLPTDEDRRRFLEAARAILSFDIEIKRLSKGRRSALLSGPIEKHDQEVALLSTLWRALQRALDDYSPQVPIDPIETRRIGLRLLMGRLVAGGLNGATDRETLLDATLQLRELAAEEQLNESRKSGRNRHRLSPTERSEEDDLLVEQLQTEVAKIRKYNPNLRTKMDRARALNRRLKDRWPTAAALIEWAARRKISI